MTTETFGVFHLFAGIGGGALGFQQAQGEWRGLHGRFRTLGAVDVDPDACADFEALTGARATCLDLFAHEDYEAFHGCPPPAGWREATPEDIRAAGGEARPDVVFSSPPCKSFSALLPRKQAESPRYQALSRLTVRGVWLALEAWRDNPPGLFILENVPRIMSRGRHLLEKIQIMLRAYGYEVQEGIHDVGEVGGLAQRRRRYLLVARHPAKVPAFLYQPPRRRVCAIGEVLGGLPMPDDPAGGPMHRLPRLKWLTWVRLALIPAGGDWRDLQGIEPGQYRITAEANRHTNKYRIEDWGEPSRTVIGSDRLGSGAPSVADPRLPGDHWPGHFRVVRWDEPSKTVTGQGANFGSNAGIVVADPRLRHEPRKGVFGVGRWEEPASTVIGAASVRGSNGMAAVADPRVRRNGALGVVGWSQPTGVVAGESWPSNGRFAVADPRIHAQGAAAVADPRLPADTEQGVWVIVAEDGTWHRPLTTLELAALQGFPTTMPDGRPLTLTGRSQAKWRERIGNAVPPPAARGIAEMMLHALLPAVVGAWVLSPFSTAIWVRAVAERLVRAVRPSIARRGG